MTRSFLLVVFTATACVMASGSLAAEPTDLEAFVESSGVTIVFSQALGTIESSDARVEVTALVATDTADASKRMRGLRLSMTDNSRLEQVYLDESLLATLREDLAGIEGGIPELEKASAPYRVQGTASCWRPAHPQRILCPSYRIGPDWSGLTLGPYGSHGFEFPAHRPAELAALIERAIEALPAP